MSRLSVPLDLTRPTSAKRRAVFTEMRVTAVLFLVPAVIIFAVFVIWPIIQSARYSTYAWDGLGPLTKFVGLGNYAQLVADPVFWRALGNNFFVVIWSLVTQIPLGIGLAILLTGRIKGASFFRTLYFAPLVLSDVIVSLLWQWVYNPSFGLVNSFLKAVGLKQFTSGWLGDEGVVLACVMVATTWRYLGFYIVIFIAAIQGIPDDLYEAARVDGASGWRLHRHITIPLLSTATRTASVVSIVGSFKFFDLIWVMTEGGPNHASELVATYMFKMAFQSRDWGYASTLAFVLFGVAFTFAIAFIVFTQTRRQTTYAQVRA